MSARILVVDDEQGMQDFLRLLLESAGYEVSLASSMKEGESRFREGGIDLVLSDIIMPDGNGLELLKAIKEQDSRAAVIMMTAYTSTKTAIEAMKLGAYDYVSKPFDVDELQVLVEKALEKTELVDENVYLRRELEEKYQFSNIIGRSPKMQEIFSLIERVARTPSTVLLQGESGTGKELIARAIHFASPRAERRFMSVNCGALPETLLESELFGHEKGAFTGAVREKKGLFRESHQGTLLLDEIGEMSPQMQVKLLRALQEKKVRKVGSSSEQAVDVRIIAATNQDLRELIERGDFREDLYYRINVIPIQLPALRQRREDIPLLVDHFIDKHCAAMGVPPRPIESDAMRALEEYRWPGNVRELENLIERILALSTSEKITAEDVPSRLLEGDHTRPGEVDLPEDGLNLEGYLDDIRANLMHQALDRASGVQTQAAELLGMTFRSFRYYARKMGVTTAGRPVEQAEGETDLNEPS
jgi:two-component system response regulator PilR (NtrC family)